MKNERMKEITVGDYFMTEMGKLNVVGYYFDNESTGINQDVYTLEWDEDKKQGNSIKMKLYREPLEWKANKLGWTLHDYKGRVVWQGKQDEEVNSKTIYSKRKFLYPEHKSASSYIAAYHGINDAGEFGSEKIFFKIASCNRITDIHYTDEDNLEEFIEVIDSIEQGVKDFKEHLIKHLNETK